MNPFVLLPLALVFGCSDPGDDTSALPSRGDCDPLVPDVCALPFPSSFYERPDGTSPTGVRLDFGATTLPRTLQGLQPAPTYWNERDGFSPWGPILARFANLSTEGLPSHDRIADSLAAGASVIVLDAETGERQPFFAELDMSGAHVPGQEVLFIRPVRPLAHGHRIVVGLRNLRDVQGAPIAPSPAFRALRDGLSSDDPDVVRRRGDFEGIFSALEQAGWSRGELTLAWDFHVASNEGITGKAVAMRDDALARVGAAGPAYRITEVRTFETGPTHARLHGTFEAPRYTEEDAPGTLLTRGPDGMPYADGTTTVPFTIVVPRTAAENPRPLKLVQYGHGLLGSQDEVESQYLAEMADRYGWILFAVDWTGMKQADIGAIQDMLIFGIDRFAIVPERSQQGLVEFVLAAALMQGAMVDDPNLQGAGPDGQSVRLVDPSEVAYYGNSQGGILGAPYAALSPVVSRAVLGVPGGPYSLLLSRSKDFTPFLALFLGLYPDQTDVSVWMGLMQTLWDSAEGSGYIGHIAEDRLPGTPEKRVLLQDAIGDHQVTTLGAHNFARALGAAQVGTPYQEVWGVPVVAGPHAGSGLAEYDFGVAPVPFENVPPTGDDDTHEDTRRVRAAQDQLDRFLRTGEVIDLCDGACDPE
ncbi:MAG: hypothetical protein RLZZ299_2535 [Pseudomonadota bacterium]